MDNADNKIMTKTEKVDYILSKSAVYFGIDRVDFVSGGGSRGAAWQKKKYIIKILYDYTPCSLKEVAKILGYKNYCNVVFHYKAIKNELSDEFYGYDKTKMIYKELLGYLKLNGYENKNNNQAKEADKRV